MGIGSGGSSGLDGLTGQVPTLSPEGGQFADLLGLVEDIGVADGQSQELLNFTEGESQKVMDASLQGPQSQAALQSAMGQMMLQKDAGNLKVGQPPPQGQTAETLVSNVAPLKMMELAALAEQGTQRIPNGETLKPDAVAAWAQAFGSNDVRRLDVETVKAPSLVVSGVDGLPRKLQPASEMTVGPASPETQQAETLKALGEAGLFGKNEATDAKSSVRGFARDNARAPAPKNASVEAKDFFMSRNDASPKAAEAAQGARAEFVPAFPGRVAKEKVDGSSQTASDFLTQKSVDFSSSVAKPVTDAALAAPVVVGASTLGSADDRRISPQSVQFVADKIDALKQQGGGRLLVELHPKDMGVVELRVTKTRGGELQVQILAEKPSTLSALQGSQSELKDRLSSIAPVQLEVGTGGTVAGGSSAASGLDAAVASKASRPMASGNSQDMLAVRRSSEKPVASEMQRTSGESQKISSVESMDRLSARVNVATDSPKGTSGSNLAMDRLQRESGANNQGWDREERREKALDRWEEAFEKRQQAS